MTLTIDSTPLLGRPVFDLWMWDYTAGAGGYAVTPGNRTQAIADLKRHGITIPCAGSTVLPPLDTSCFDAAGNLAKPLTFAAFDTWVKEWPSVHRYYVFGNMGAALLKFRAGSPEFARAVSQWARAWADHNHQLGLKPRQVIFHPVDEPHSESDYQLFVEWITAFKSGTDDIACFINPAGGTSALKFKSGSEAIRLADLVSPELSRFLKEQRSDAAILGWN